MEGRQGAGVPEPVASRETQDLFQGKPVQLLFFRGLRAPDVLGEPHLEGRPVGGGRHRSQDAEPPLGAPEVALEHPPARLLAHPVSSRKEDAAAGAAERDLAPVVRDHDDLPGSPNVLLQEARLQRFQELPRPTRGVRQGHPEAVALLEGVDEGVQGKLGRAGDAHFELPELPGELALADRHGIAGEEGRSGDPAVGRGEMHGSEPPEGLELEGGAQALRVHQGPEETRRLGLSPKGRPGVVVAHRGFRPTAEQGPVALGGLPKVHHEAPVAVLADPQPHGRALPLQVAGVGVEVEVPEELGLGLVGVEIQGEGPGGDPLEHVGGGHVEAEHPLRGELRRLPDGGRVGLVLHPLHHPPCPARLRTAARAARRTGPPRLAPRSGSRPAGGRRTRRRPRRTCASRRESHRRSRPGPRRPVPRRPAVPV